MKTFTTAAELQLWLLAHFPTENGRHEWKEWHSLKSNVSGRKGKDLVSYVSAFANREGGCVVIGAQDGHSSGFCDWLEGGWKRFLSQSDRPNFLQHSI